jgi:polygalacturonase
MLYRTVLILPCLLLASLGLRAATPETAGCNPLSFGAVADGKTDNTGAIQSAIDACAKRGGGTVVLSATGRNSVYVTGPLTLKSHVYLDIQAEVTLQGTRDHTRYAGAFINWVFQPNEALIAANGASDVAIEGDGTIDGAGGQLQPDGGPSWWSLGRKRSIYRPWLVEFYQCDRAAVHGVTLRNSPMWTLVFRFSKRIVVSRVKVRAPANSPNTDGVNLVGSTNASLSNLNISVGDDNIAIKSGFPIDPADPRQQGLPQMATSRVHMRDIIAADGHGISIGSESANGINNVTIERVHFLSTGNGLRLKTARDRGNQIYAITASDLTMSEVMNPLVINTYYPASGGPTEPPYQAAQTVSPTTPYVHDITIRNLVATGATGQSIIEGLPESCVYNLTLDGVSLQTSGPGLVLRHVSGAFNNVTSSAGSTSPPFIVQENVKVTVSGSTPALPATAAQEGQMDCNSQRALQYPPRPIVPANSEHR